MASKQKFEKHKLLAFPLLGLFVCFRETKQWGGGERNVDFRFHALVGGSHMRPDGTEPAPLVSGSSALTN